MEGNLSVELLYQIMARLGARRAKEYTTGLDLLDLVSPDAPEALEREVFRNLNRHVRYLESSGYLEVGSELVGGPVGRLDLTAMGQRFVQPGLAEFGKEPLLPSVVESIEKAIITYPAEKRDGFLFELRDAIARNSPEFVAQLLIQALPKLLGS